MTERQQLTLAALLHDVGKVLQRAEYEYGPEAESMEQQLCPQRHGYSSHRHVLHTFDCLLNQCSFLGGAAERVAGIAAHHHKPRSDDPLDQLLARADRLSAAIDRADAREEPGRDRDAYKRVRLRTIFSQVGLSPQQTAEQEHWYYDLQPLGLPAKTYFPSPPGALDPPLGESLVAEYRSLADGLVQALHAIPQCGFSVLVDSLLRILERYTWCVPSSTIDFPDISLFDHTRTTAAIAAALHQAGEANVRDDAFLLVTGDISGIQDYMYRLAQPEGMKGLAKRVRGRSLHVAMLSKMAAAHLTDAAELYRPNVIFSAGGNFACLLDNTEQTRHRLDAAAEEIDHWLLDTFEGNLGLAVAQLPIAENALDDFAAHMGRASEMLKADKARRFSRLWRTGQLLTREEVAPAAECRSCGAAMIEDADLCELCQLTERIGAALPDARWLLYTSGDVAPECVGEQVEFFGGWRACLLEGDLPSPLPETVWRCERLRNSPEGLSKLANSAPLVAEALMTEEARVEEGDVASFTHLAQAAEGADRIGILRMDVDRLGMVFGPGLEMRAGPGWGSISRFCTMSRQVDLFFSAHLDEVCTQEADRWRSEAETPLADHLRSPLYITYAGGDDLFIVGPWSLIPRVAQGIRDDFRHYVCENPDITISGGCFVCKGEYPIRRAAEEAGTAEHVSKTWGRDAMTMFGVTAPWESEDGVPDFGELVKFGDWLHAASSGEGPGIARGFLHSLLQMHDRYVEGSEVDWNVIPLLVYQIERNVPDDLQVLGENAKQLLRARLVADKDAAWLRSIRLPASYALLRLRKGGRDAR